MANLPQPWLGMKDVDMLEWATAITQRLEQLSGGDIPRQVTGVTLTPVFPGVTVAWNKTKNADSYVIYRNSENNPSGAEVVIQLFDADNISFFDSTVDQDDGATLYYWVQARNAVGQASPLSAVASADNPAFTVPDASVGILNVVTITSNTVLTAEHNVVIADTSGGAITITLPPPSTAFENDRTRGYYIRNTGTVFGVTLGPDDTETIDGFDEIVIPPGASKLVVTDGTNWYTFMLDQGAASVMGLPFEGVLGSGRHGDLVISSNTTATEVIHQLTSLDVQSGFTWTAKQQNPGGLVISVKGRCTIAGTIDCNYLGGSGGTTQTSSSNGFNGKQGFNYGGVGGGGGAAWDGGGGQISGGHSAPTRSGHVLGGFNPGGVERTSASVSWAGDNTASTNNQLRREAGAHITPSAAGAFDTGSNGTAGSSFAAAAASSGDSDGIFDSLWAFFRPTIFGWGSGGGGGANDQGASGGKGGNGGGYLVILCDELDFTGTINVNGQAGANGATDASVDQGVGGGGGGGGGVVIIGYRTLIASTGTINVNGGAAGTGDEDGVGVGTDGGAGGAGFKKVFDMRI